MKVLPVLAIFATLSVAVPEYAAAKPKRAMSVVIRNLATVDICEVRVFRNGKQIRKRPKLKHKLETRHHTTIALKTTKKAILVEATSCDGAWSASRRLAGLSGVVDISVVGARYVAKPKAEPNASLMTLMTLTPTNICPPHKDLRIRFSCPATRVNRPSREREPTDLLAPF